MNLWNRRGRTSGGTPTPLSITSKRVSYLPSSAERLWETRTSTEPCSVNLIALLTKLKRICRTRPGSLFRTSMASSATSIVKDRPFCVARLFQSPDTASSRPWRSKSTISRVRRPASIFERSRMSLSWASKPSPDSLIIATWRCCSLDSWLANNKSAIPSTPFKGVRNSWLMVARNSDLARFAASDWSRASFRSSAKAVNSPPCRSS